jgi:hypothetical protein
MNAESVEPIVWPALGYTTSIESGPVESGIAGSAGLLGAAGRTGAGGAGAGPGAGAGGAGAVTTAGAQAADTTATAMNQVPFQVFDIFIPGLVR